MDNTDIYTTDTLFYQGKTMNFIPLRSGGVLLEVY